MRQGQSVEIYRNLNRKGIWFSIRDRKTGLVVDRLDLDDDGEIYLCDATFNVSKAGRERVLREKRKNVHALIRGLVMPSKGMTYLTPHGHYPLKVKYDPYKYDSFIGTNMDLDYSYKLTEAAFVTLDARGVTAWLNAMQLMKMAKV